MRQGLYPRRFFAHTKKHPVWILGSYRSCGKCSFGCHFEFTSCKPYRNDDRLVLQEVATSCSHHILVSSIRRSVQGF